MRSAFSFLLSVSVALVVVSGVVRADNAVVSPFTRDQLVAALARDLSAHFNLEGDLQLELLRDWTPPSRLAANWNVEVLEYPTMPSSSMLVRCRLLANHEAAGEMTMVLRGSLWRDAWVARQPLTAGEAFDAAMLEARRVDLFRERDVLPATAADRSLVMARSVSTGRLLTWRDVNRRPLVKKGQLVEVSAIDGLLVITMKALALQSGAQGDTVTVRNPESRRDFSALVIDENRVQVRF